MMRRILAIVALAALALPQAAQACLYTQRPEQVGHANLHACICELRSGQSRNPLRVPRAVGASRQ